jgi:hypothetical protein
MIHPMRTLAYELLVDPFVQLWRKVWESGPLPPRKEPSVNAPARSGKGGSRAAA